MKNNFKLKWMFEKNNIATYPIYCSYHYKCRYVLYFLIDKITNYKLKIFMCSLY